jgi:L-ascorbate metabolism protein UlaG (beta-lactamase superfamily)
MLPDNTIWHLGHSSHIMKIHGKLLIFDYAFEPGLIYLGDETSPGYVTPRDLDSETVIVFVSHAHRDHFNPQIFSWWPDIHHIWFIVPDHIPAANDRVKIVRPMEDITLEGVRIRPLPSSDIGVSYSLVIGNTHIYFAGDNALWDWAGAVSETRYIRELMDYFTALPPIDIAFHVCDPRLSGKGVGGIYAFASVFQPKILIPIHTFGKYRFNKKVQKELARRGYRGQFWCIDRQGASLGIDVRGQEPEQGPQV